MRLGLLMRRMALDWTLSRRQGVDSGAPPQTWEQFFFLVGYVEERPWWPIQSPNKGKKKKASS